MAGGVITTGNVPRLLQDGLDNVFGQTYDNHPIEYDKIYSINTGTKNFQLDQQMEGLGLAAFKDEGDDIEFDSAQQGFTPRYVHLTAAKGFIMTMEAMQDERYGVFKKRAQLLAFGQTQLKEITGANVLNNGFDSGFTMPGGDGLELFSSVHINGPSGGTFANELPVAADFAEAALEDLLIIISKATDPRGLRIALMPERLVGPSDLAFEFQRVMGSVLQNDTANNATNAVRDLNAIPGGHTINHYLTNTKAWFITTNSPEGMKYYTRMAIKFEEDNAFTSGNAREKAVQRYSFGFSDPRGIYGSEGT